MQNRGGFDKILGALLSCVATQARELARARAMRLALPHLPETTAPALLISGSLLKVAVF